MYKIPVQRVKMLLLAVLIFCILRIDAATKLQTLFQEQASKMAGECLSEVGATMDDLAGIIKFEIPTTSAGMCLITCIHEKFGMQDSNGKMLVDGTVAFLEALKEDPEFHELVKGLFLHCVSTVSNDDEKCVVGNNLMACVVNGGKHIGLFDL